MAFEVFPSKAHNNRAVSFAEYERLHAPVGVRMGLAGGYNGIVPVSADSTGLQVKIAAGTRCHMQGYEWRSTSETAVAIGGNASGQPRIDLLVLRLDRAAASPNEFKITPVVIQGAPASSPVAPSPLQQLMLDGTGYLDMPLAEVTVAAGATTIAETDVRNRAWWISQTGYYGLSTARPLTPEPGLVWREHDTGLALIGAGTGGWRRVQHTVRLNMPSPSGWTAAPLRVARSGDIVNLMLRVQRTGANVAADTDVTIATLAPIFRPQEWEWAPYYCTGPQRSGFITVNAGTGTIVIDGGAGGFIQGGFVVCNASWQSHLL